MASDLIATDTALADLCRALEGSAWIALATQVAAAYLGYDDQVGYAALVTAITGVILDKTHTRTDWSKRPLSSAQYQYAEDDVRYLMPVYENLHERLAAAGRIEWGLDDCGRLSEPGPDWDESARG